MSNLIKQNDKHYKRCKVIMLPSSDLNNSHSSMVIEKCIKKLSDVNIGELKYTSRILHSKEYFKAQELYIVTNDEIRENDYFMSSFYSYLIHNTEEWRKKQKELLLTTNLSKLTFNKVIASTDPTLKLPKLSHKFINDYCNVESLNEILVEWNSPCCKCDTTEKLVNCIYNTNEDDCTAPNPNDDFYGLNVKTNSLNEIIIEPIKKSWNETELFDCMQYYYEYIILNGDYITPQDWYNNHKHF